MKRTLIFLLILAMVCPLAAPALADEAPAVGEKLVYGTSGEGQELVAYRFGSGQNVLVMGFAIHGFEDNFDRDGLALVYTAEKLMAHLQSSDLVTLHNWTVYVLPCMNPDGTYRGTTNNGPGRCTTTYIDPQGNLVRDKGIDMNRSFPVGFRPHTGSRNFNSTEPLACRESRALAAFLPQIKGSKANVFFDVHGWYQQIITTSERIVDVVEQQFPENEVSKTVGGSGYLTSYAHSLGYETCLLELPEHIDSMDEFVSGSCVPRVLNCVDGILKTEAPICDGDNHKFETTEIPADCENNGSITEKCTLCGFTTTSVLPATGHSLDQLTCLQERTATKAGITSGVCTVCGDQELVIEPSVFEDVGPDQFYSDALDASYEAGFIRGITDTTFGPDETLSRAMLVTVLHRFQGEPESQAETPFEDLPGGAYYEQAVRWAYENGIVNGVTATRFAPDAPVTRQQAVAIFHRYVDTLGLDNGLRTQEPFPDHAQIGAYAREAAQWAAANGIILGDERGNFLPENFTTRAQAVTILHRVKGYVQAQSPAPGE